MLFGVFKGCGRYFKEAREGNNTLYLCFVKTNLCFCAIFCLFGALMVALSSIFSLVFLGGYAILKRMKCVSFSLAALLSCTSLLYADSNKDLGKVMFVGDSITHGHSSASYRWALHKLFVDNGMDYESVGIITGNQAKTPDILTASDKYGSEPFANVHSAQSSARAWEIVGRKSGPRFKGTNITNWLGQSDTTCTGAQYTDALFTGDDAPQYFFMMIGTNDLLSDHGNKLESVSRTAVPELNKDVDGIIKSMRTANKNAPITLTTIPVWAHRNGIDAADTHTTVEKYNEAMKKSAKSRKVKVAEINEGLRDISDERPFHGHADLFAADGLHPNNQGSLIIAGNVALTMAWPSRTAGLERKSVVDFPLKRLADFTLLNIKMRGSAMQFVSLNKKECSVSVALPDADVASVEAKIRVGDGEKNGWSQNDGLRISVDTKSAAGSLLVTECYLKWGNRVIYCTDMSKNTAPLRLCYVKGDASKGIAAGFYIWLGDKLVGEALPAEIGTATGVKLEFEGAGTAIVAALAVDATGAYAPAQ